MCGSTDVATGLGQGFGRGLKLGLGLRLGIVYKAVNFNRGSAEPQGSASICQKFRGLSVTKNNQKSTRSVVCTPSKRPFEVACTPSGFMNFGNLVLNKRHPVSES